MNRRLIAFLMALAVTSFAFGQNAVDDPPSRVARLSTITGAVSLQTEDSPAPEPADINRPVTSGDRLLTESESRAELSLGTAAVRLDERTDLSISNLDGEIAQLALNSGAVSVHVRELANGETFEIDTPNAMIRLTQPGDYRVDVDSDGASVLSVRNGDAEINGGSGVVHVHDQQQARLGPQERYADVTVLGAPDAFDDWSMSRERALADSASESEKYVSREVVGYEDLDEYGGWSSDPLYGEVWTPTVVGVGWAPYTYGYWSYIGPWGWTWIDRAPWGFAPFHYGRWAYVRERWCWVPGPRHRRPVYAPALVSFSGRHDFADSRHERPRGWIPLGPREVYVPSRNVSPRYLRNVNVGNTRIDDNTRITNAYRNRGRDVAFLNRNAPGVNGMVRAPNNGVPLNSFNGNGSTERWRTGPGWRTGPTQSHLATSDDHRVRSNRPPWTSNPARIPDNDRRQMTNPRAPNRDSVSIQRYESQRDRMRREVAEATRSGSVSQRDWSSRRNEASLSQQRDGRSSGNRSSTATPSNNDRPRTYSGPNRSYSGARWGTGSSPSQSRPAPSPRVERSPPPRVQSRPASPPPQASRPSSGGGNRGGDPFRSGGFHGSHRR